MPLFYLTKIIMRIIAIDNRICKPTQINHLLLLCASQLVFFAHLSDSVLPCCRDSLIELYISVIELWGSLLSHKQRVGKCLYMEASFSHCPWNHLGRKPGLACWRMRNQMGRGLSDMGHLRRQVSLSKIELCSPSHLSVPLLCFYFLLGTLHHLTWK